SIPAAAGNSAASWIRSRKSEAGVRCAACQGGPPFASTARWRFACPLMQANDILPACDSAALRVHRMWPTAVEGDIHEPFSHAGRGRQLDRSAPRDLRAEGGRRRLDPWRLLLPL